MKTITTFWILVLLMASIQSKAVIRTVSNDINKPAQYPDIPQAIAAANSGDTIYVNGTQYTYSDFIVNRKLVIIGAGFSVANQFNLNSNVNNISFFKDAGPTNDGSGTVISGFKINSQIGLASSSLNVSNIKFFRNQIGKITGIPMINWAIYNNLFFGVYPDGAINGGNNSSNVVIQNNIFYGSQSAIWDFNQPSVVIDHNLFINVTGNSSGAAASVSNLIFSIITNNIFTSSSGTLVMSNVTQCTLNNNLSASSNVNSVAPANSFLSNNNTGGGNQVGVSPPLLMLPI